MRILALLILLTATLFAEGVEPTEFGLSFKMPNGFTGNGAPLNDRLWTGQWRDDARGFTAQLVASRLYPGKGDPKAALVKFTDNRKLTSKIENQQTFEQLGSVGAYLATPKENPATGTTRRVVIFTPAYSYVWTFVALDAKQGKALEAEIRKVLGTLRIL